MFKDYDDSAWFAQAKVKKNNAQPARVEEEKNITKNVPLANTTTNKKTMSTNQKTSKSVFDEEDDSDWFVNAKVGKKVNDESTNAPNKTSTLAAVNPEKVDKTAAADALVKPLGQVLTEMVSGRDLDSSQEIEAFRALEKDKLTALDSYERQFAGNTDIVNLIKQYRLILTYQKQFESYSEGDIKAWAKQNAATASLPEFIAILDTATFLKHKYHLRDPQIIATLTFSNTGKGKGLLSQIQTGEGKTTIVALLAIIKASRGEFVDVITSNTVLAQAAVSEQSALYDLFDLTVATNNPPDNKDNSEAPNEKSAKEDGPKNCYKAKIVYGCISNFQFDYLRDTFEGLETRAGRPFGAAILDEVDSIVIDNGSHIAKLSGPLPGMDYFRYIYVNIWQALEQLHASGSNIDTVKAALKQQKNSFIPTELIPGYLIEYARKSLDRWIDNAVYAKYHCHQNRQYVIKEKDGEKVVTPVDYSNTGVTLDETIWSHGLHQFLQLKHGLYLAPENLTSSFISNLGYVNKYNNNIYGLTGTLGSEHEQSLLSKVYQVNYAKIPTFKNKRFAEIPGIVANDNEWIERIVAEICNKATHEHRAVLVIAETIADANHLEEMIKYALANYYTAYKARVTKYINEDISHAGEMDVGDILISTNIAGRGTDLKTTAALEKNGGLHVVVGFLPRNKRVEDQAFGRTARQGKLGTAQIVIRRSEAAAKATSIASVKAARDKAEKKRIQDIIDKKLDNLRFDDAIFSLFSNLYSNFKKETKQDPGSYFLCSDLKEWWAFYLESLDEKDKKNLNAATAFHDFYSSQKTQKIIKEKLISHNPYYGIRLAEYLIKNRFYDNAKKNLDNALSIAGSNPDILYSLYLKYFEICIESGNALQDRINRAIGDLFMITHIKNDGYKEEAKKYLAQAMAGIKKEIYYIDAEKNKNPFIAHFYGRVMALDVFHNNLTQLMEQITGKATEEGKYQFDASKIQANANHSGEMDEVYKAIRAAQDPSGVVRDIVNRKLLEHMSQNEVDKKWKEIDQRVNQEKQAVETSVSDDGFVIASRQSDYFDHLDENDSNQKKLKESVKKKEVSELYVIGLENIYGLKQIHDVASLAMTVAKCEMAGGIILQAAAIATKPIAAVSQALDTASGLLISESICGLISEILSGEKKFDEAEYWKNKGISYGVSAGIALLGGMAAVANKSEYVAKAKLAYMEKMKEFFQNIGLTKNLNFDKIASKIPASAIADEGASFSGQLFGKFASAAQSAAMNQFMDKLLSPALSEIFKGIKPEIEKRVRAVLEAKTDKNTLQLVAKDEILKFSSAFIEKTNTSVDEIAKQMAQEISVGSLQELKTDSWKANLAGYALGTFINNAVLVSQISHYAEDYCIALNEELKNKKLDQHNDANAILALLCEQVSEKVYRTIVEIVANTLNDGAIGPLMGGGPHKPSHFAAPALSHHESHPPAHATTSKNSHAHEPPIATPHVETHSGPSHQPANHESHPPAHATTSRNSHAHEPSIATPHVETHSGPSHQLSEHESHHHDNEHTHSIDATSTPNAHKQESHNEHSDSHAIKKTASPEVRNPSSSPVSVKHDVEAASAATKLKNRMSLDAIDELKNQRVSHADSPSQMRRERRLSTPFGETLGGRRDHDILEKGSAGQVQLGILAGSSDFGYSHIKCTVVDSEGKTRTKYLDKNGALHDVKPDHIDDSKIPWVKCDLNPDGGLSHFTSARSNIHVAELERNCGPMAIYIEHERLKGRSEADIHKQINENPHKFGEHIENLAKQSRQNIIDFDPEKLRNNVQDAIDADFFNPGHKIILKDGKYDKDTSRVNAAPKENWPYLNNDYEQKTGRKLALQTGKNTEGRYPTGKDGLTANHRISDVDIQKIVLEDLKKGGKGDLIKQLQKVFYFTPGHEDIAKLKGLLKKYEDCNINKNKQEKANLAQDIATIFCQHPGQISLGNARQNSSIQNHLDLNAPIDPATGKHKLTPRSRRILENLLDKNNADVLALISKPIKRDGKILSSQYCEPGMGNIHKSNIDAGKEKMTPNTERLFNDIGFYARKTPKLKRKRDDDDDSDVLKHATWSPVDS